MRKSVLNTHACLQFDEENRLVRGLTVNKNICFRDVYSDRTVYADLQVFVSG